MTASGKSFLGRSWATRHSFPYFNTDIVRKQLAGLKENEPQPSGINDGIYSTAFTRRTYDAMIDKADLALQDSTNRCTVLDGSYLDPNERDKIRNTLGKKCRIIFVLCKCSEETVRTRLTLRSNDPNAVSDGRWEIFLHQQKVFTSPTELPPEQLLVLNTEAPLESLMTQLDNILVT
jgi:predicted kinase